MLEGACQGRMEHLLWLERLCSALWVSSFPIDTWHFKRGLAAVSEEVIPEGWGSATLPSVFITSAQWEAHSRCIRGPIQSSGVLGMKQLALVLL